METLSSSCSNTPPTPDRIIFLAGDSKSLFITCYYHTYFKPSTCDPMYQHCTRTHLLHSILSQQGSLSGEPCLIVCVHLTHTNHKCVKPLFLLSFITYLIVIKCINLARERYLARCVDEILKQCQATYTTWKKNIQLFNNSVQENNLNFVEDDSTLDGTYWYPIYNV
jgi:hypothetical protein